MTKIAEYTTTILKRIKKFKTRQLAKYTMDLRNTLKKSPEILVLYIKKF